MPDREKVIKGLECHAKAIGCREHCPYWRSETLNCSIELADDAIALLKAQEPKPPVVKENSYGWKFYYCPSCGKEFYQNNKFSFCEKCGQAVKWK